MKQGAAFAFGLITIIGLAVLWTEYAYQQGVTAATNQCEFDDSARQVN